MMATVAHHKAGDISRDVPDLCFVESEDGDAYIGHWVEGFGFQHVRFPKATTRELTAEERERYDGSYLDLGGTAIGPIRIDDDDPLLDERRRLARERAMERIRRPFGGAL
jgi:hypothetical protein